MKEPKLVDFLNSLQKVKRLKDSDGVSFACFGAYDESSEDCNLQYSQNKICGACKDMHEVASDDWIEDMLKELE